LPLFCRFITGTFLFSLVDIAGWAGDDGAAAHGIDEDVDAAVGVHGAPDGVLDGRGVERVGPDPDRPAARAGDLGGEPVERALFHIDGHHRATLAADDTRRGPADARSGRRDQCDFAFESHRGSPLSSAMKGLNGSQTLHVLAVRFGIREDERRVGEERPELGGRRRGPGLVKRQRDQGEGDGDQADHPDATIDRAAASPGAFSVAPGARGPKAA
jgi:hypothetical protein